MPEIKAKTFAETMNNCRLALIDHCRQNGINATNADSMSNLINKNSFINNGQTNKHLVEWIDIDSTVLKSELVEDNGSSEAPENPSYDSDYLEFDEWVKTDDTTNITDDIQCGACYQVKEFDFNGTMYRPTILRFIPDTAIDVSLKYALTKSTATLFIDWGDNSAIESYAPNSSSIQTITHNYSSAGIYYIKVAVDLGTFIFSGLNGPFTTTTMNKYIDAIYISKLYGNTSTSLISFKDTNLRTAVLPRRTNDETITIRASLFTYCRTLKALIVPKNSCQNNFLNCEQMKLNYLILPKDTNLTTMYFSTPVILSKLILPDALTEFRNYNNLSVIDIKLPRTLNNSAGTVDISRITFINRQIIDCQSINISAFGSSTPTSNVSRPIVLYPDSITTYPTAVTIPDWCGVKLPINMTDVSITIAADSPFNYLVLANNHNGNIIITYTSIRRIPDNILIEIARKAKDLTGQTSKTITLTADFSARMNMSEIYINQLGERVKSTDANAKSLLQTLLDKNWTISFS